MRPTQEALIDAAKADLKAFGIRASFSVRIDWREKHTKQCQGICYDSETKPVIWINPFLHGCALYRVVLHELGHANGLGHRKTGIMAPNRYQPVDFDTREPTPTQRKAWAFEIAQEVLFLRRAQWRAA